MAEIVFIACYFYCYFFNLFILITDCGPIMSIGKIVIYLFSKKI